MTTDLALGALAAAAAATCYETSYALQALEARRVPVRETLQVSLLARLARRPLWLGAIVLAALGWPLQLLALAFAPLTLVQPVIALGVVLLLVLAAWILHERIGRREILASAGIVLGVGGIAAAAPERSSSHAGPAAVTLALALLASFVALPYVTALLRRPLAALWLVVSAGAGDALAAFGAKLLVDEVSATAWFAVVGFTVLSAAALGAALLSETSALQRFPAARVGPAVMAMQVAIPVLLAPLVGGEKWSNTPLHGGVLLVSLGLVTACGVTLTASRAITGLAENEGSRGGTSRVGEVRRSPPFEGTNES